MKQVVIIHGGDTFDSYETYLEFLKSLQIDASIFSKMKWKERLGAALGEEFEVLSPAMPNKLNAKFLEWKIWFDKLVPFFTDEISLVGHSLGGSFLAKYLSENDLPKKIRALFLVSACFESTDTGSIADFIMPKSFTRLTAQCPRIFIYHSTDDPVVSFTDAEKFKTVLPQATFRVFNDRGHFSQADFPEIKTDIGAVYGS